MPPRKPKQVFEVRGYAFGREAFPPTHETTVAKVIDRITEAFAAHRGLVCFFESGTLHPDGTFAAHTDGVCYQVTDTLKTSAAAA
jgi:hypothetical protein